MTIRAWRSHGARSNNPGTPFDRESPRKGRPWGPRAPLHHRCVGCGTQGRPGRSDSRFALYERSGDRRRGTRRIEAATAIEWPAVRSALREAVPGEVRAGSAGAPARVHGSMSRPAVRGSRRSGRCTCAKHSAQASERIGERASLALARAKPEHAERSEATSAARSAREVAAVAAARASTSCGGG